eukprot:6491455-Amphidinium_carterae.2
MDPLFALCECAVVETSPTKPEVCRCPTDARRHQSRARASSAAYAALSLQLDVPFSLFFQSVALCGLVALDAMTTRFLTAVHLLVMDSCDVQFKPKSLPTSKCGLSKAFLALHLGEVGLLTTVLRWRT